MDFEFIKSFYKKDKEYYIIKKNSEIIKWIDDRVKEGYKPFINTNYLQHLIDMIALWYELKYPERDYENIEGKKDYSFPNLKSLSNDLSFEQLMYHLPDIELFLMRGCYRSKGLTELPVFEHEKVISFEKLIHFSITKNTKIKSERDFDFYADYITGSIKKVYTLNSEYNTLIESRINDPNDLFDLFDLKELMIKDKEIDMHELDEIIKTHQTDMELRDKIIYLTSLKILYSKTTTPRHGFDRAKRLITDYNREFNSNISTDYLDAVIKDYSSTRETGLFRK